MMQSCLFLLIFVPALAGIICLFIRSQVLRKNLITAVLLATLVFSVLFFIDPPEDLTFGFLGYFSLILSLNNLAKVILIFANLFGLLISVYSRDYTRVKASRTYFSYLAWLVASVNLVCLSGDFLTFVFSWGATLTLLYALLNIGSGESANKALTIVGFGDFSLILGVSLYVYSTGTAVMPVGAMIALENPLRWLSFILMLIAAFAKAGCGPLHTWIPTASTSAPLPVMAILPASLDKLLGIYLLSRICVDFFVLNNAALCILLLCGALTIMFAVMMALIQHDLRKLLSYHAISQVGYMVLGFGTGVPLGVAAGLFHMINHALYKSGLFLTGGSVGEKKNTFELENLGALAVFMPVTFATGLIFALSISGVPPFNGFASKWMLYQGLIGGFSANTSVAMKSMYIFSLLAAMFGSVLTLASFIKFIHAIFLGEDKQPRREKISEVSLSMKIPVLVLAALCVLLGVFPHLFLRSFIEPYLSEGIGFPGAWNSLFAFLWLAAGLLLGAAFYKSGKVKRLRQDGLFIGGEQPDFGPNFPATEFYRSIEEGPLLKRVYQVLKSEALDLYNCLGSVLKISAFLLFIFVDRFMDMIIRSAGLLVLGLSYLFRKLHTGVLDFYLAWSLIGLLVLFFILMVR